nr:amino acid transporter AVT1C-like [Parasteatoda tepidariorum]
MAGAGVLVLPKALSDTGETIYKHFTTVTKACGWGGIVFMTLCCAISMYSGVCLARCRIILEERYEEFREKIRKPYPAIAQQAYGTKMKYFVSICVEINFIGVSVVYLLLPAELIAKLLDDKIPFCGLILILAAVLCPMMWFGTPKDFKFVAVIAFVTTIGAIIFLFVAMGQHAAKESLKPTHNPPTFMSFFLSIGVILFAFGGTATFPTFQNDMINKKEFPAVMVVSFGAVYLVYSPVALLGYYLYGDDVSIDITDTIPPSIFKSLILILLTIRTIFAFVMIINASSQEFESIFKVPDRFGWKRIAVRVSLLLFVLFIAVSIPRFGKVLTVVGASVITLTTSVFPFMFYYKLCSQSNSSWPDRKLPVYKKVILFLIMVFGVIGGSIATYLAAAEIVRDSGLSPPCYINTSISARAKIFQSLNVLQNMEYYV